MGICLLTATILDVLGWKLSYGGMQLDIVQKATASIACLLCVQDELGMSRAAGWMRIKVTCMAAIAGIATVWVDDLIGNAYVSIVLIMFGVVLTMFLCKCIRAPYMNCRIGAISYILIAVTLTHEARMAYAVLRVGSTVYGILVVMFVTWIASKIKKK